MAGANRHANQRLLTTAFGAYLMMRTSCLRTASELPFRVDTSVDTTATFLLLSATLERMDKINFPAANSASDVPIWQGIPDRSPDIKSKDLGGRGALGAFLAAILKALGLGPLRDRRQD